MKYYTDSNHILSKDGDVHFISGRRLAELYGVPLSKCVNDPRKLKVGEVYTILSVQANGENYYKLPEPKRLKEMVVLSILRTDVSLIWESV